MNEIDEIVNRIKSKTHIKKETNRSSLLNRVLICISLVLITLILNKTNENFNTFLKEEVFSKSLSFTKFSNYYEDKLGDITPTKKEEAFVFSNDLLYTSITDYKDGECITLKSSSLVTALESGIVVFSGEKEGYGNVVIIQGIDAVDIWYGNITDISVKNYDYITKGTPLGNTVDNNLYLVIKKEETTIPYEEYTS